MVPSPQIFVTLSLLVIQDMLYIPDNVRQYILKKRVDIYSLEK